MTEKLLAALTYDMNSLAPQHEIVNTPLDRMLAAFPDAHQRNNGWWTHDDNPRFDFIELPNGDIRLHPWTGSSDDDILKSVHLTRASLYAKPGQHSTVFSHDKLDLITLSQYMRIDWQWLMREGYSDSYSYTYSGGKTVKCVKIGGYCTPDGVENGKHQVRLSLHNKPRFLWNQNIPGNIIPCGLHYLDRARESGYLVIGEGASDWATMTFHGIPFLGIPGAEQIKTLNVELVEDIPVIYIIEEPDQAKKLRDTGQGFYKNVRQHLRDNGYQGPIFSLRFMESTGYKDPSDLHKSIYATCKEQSEGPFRLEVTKRFLAAIEQAIEQAIPEGNEGLYPVATARDWSNISFEEFFQQVWAVSSEFLSPIQKAIVCYLFLYMRQVEPDEELGWFIDAAKMAPKVGLKGPKGKEKFLYHLSYLYQSLGIINKTHRANKEYINDDEGPEQVRYKGTSLYIQFRPGFYTPGGYCVVTQDQHKSGGPRIAFDECEFCGSRHLKHFAVQCVDCGHVMYPPIEPEEEQQPLQEKVVESTLSPQENQSHDDTGFLPEETFENISIFQPKPIIPETPNLGVSGYEEIEEENSYIESITDPQFGGLGNLFSPLVSPPVSHAPFAENGLPTRMTYCCNAPFQIGAHGPECSNPACPEKREQVLA